MDRPDPCKEPNLNTGNPWSSWDDQEIRSALDDNCSIEEIAGFCVGRLPKFANA
jgi:hypothetical protein